jgi:hypothetical protein
VITTPLWPAIWPAATWRAIAPACARQVIGIFAIIGATAALSVDLFQRPGALLASSALAGLRHRCRCSGRDPQTGDRAGQHAGSPLCR